VTCIFSVNKLEAELAGFSAVFFIVRARRGDKIVVVLMLCSGYSLWIVWRRR